MVMTEKHKVSQGTSNWSQKNYMASFAMHFLHFFTCMHPHEPLSHEIFIPVLSTVLHKNHQKRAMQF